MRNGRLPNGVSTTLTIASERGSAVVIPFSNDHAELL